MAARLHHLPVLARGLDLNRVMAVEEEDRALVAGDVRRDSTVDQEPDLRAVWVCVGRGQEHRLVCHVRIAVGAMRQEGIVAKGP
jgi:hypothetical protein